MTLKHLNCINIYVIYNMMYLLSTCSAEEKYYMKYT